MPARLVVPSVSCCAATAVTAPLRRSQRCTTTSCGSISTTGRTRARCVITEPSETASSSNTFSANTPPCRTWSAATHAVVMRRWTAGFVMDLRYSVPTSRPRRTSCYYRIIPTILCLPVAETKPHQRNIQSRRRVIPPTMLHLLFAAGQRPAETSETSTPSDLVVEAQPHRRLRLPRKAVSQIVAVGATFLCPYIAASSARTRLPAADLSAST